MTFNKLVTISDKCVNVLKSVYPSISYKFVNVPNLTSSSFIKKQANEFYPIEYKNSKCINSNVTILLSIGRLSEQKGFDYAVQSAKILKDSGIKFVWFIIGEGELKNNLEQQIRLNHLENNLQLLGIRSNPYPYIANADVIVQSSRYEGKSIVLDEAKILCKTIVVTKYTTVFDQIEPDKEGLIVEMNSISIANGISKVILDSELRIRFSEYLAQHKYENSEEIVQYYKLMED